MMRVLHMLALAQGEIAGKLVDEGAKSFHEGGFKAVAALAIAVAIIALMGLIGMWRANDKRTDALAAAYDKKLEAKDAIIVRLADKLESVSTRATDIAARSEETVEQNTRFLEVVKERLPRI